MKIARFEHDGLIRHGEVRDEKIIEFSGGLFETPAPTGANFNLSDVRLLAPCEPSKVVCLGRNYADHAKEVGGDVPEEPCIFIKPSTTVIGPEDMIVYPTMSARVDYEAELAAVIGRRAHNVDESRAGEYVFGYTCLNDVTARDLQRKDGQWTRGKSFDTFCPIGPWVETELDPGALEVRARLNGSVVQSGNTRDMIFKIHFIVSFLSRIMTLLPGDVIGTGTPEGIGPMQPGDEIEIFVENIGTLKNRVEKFRR